MAAVAFVVVVVSLAPLLVGALPGNVNEDNFKQFCKTTKGFKFRPKPVKLTDLMYVFITLLQEYYYHYCYYVCVDVLVFVPCHAPLCVSVGFILQRQGQVLGSP
eukprot:m.43607 g.43607  ORF g.43607 m.43607 type:complete len:104 (+) comp10563_c0_seq4:75-386(+)